MIHTLYLHRCDTQLNIPGLQRVCERSCIACGAPADLYCSRCAVTPYCSELCQRKDWLARHNAVCHNLTRLNSSRSAPSERNEIQATSDEAVDKNSNTIVVPTLQAPLRRPRSPNGTRSAQPQRNGLPNNYNKDNSYNKDNGYKKDITNNTDNRASGGNQRGRTTHAHYTNTNKTKFVPSGHQPTPPLRSPRAAPSVNNNQQSDLGDEEWGGIDEGTPQQTPALKSEPAQMDKKIEPSKPSFETSKPKIETPKAQGPSSISIDEGIKPNSRMGANFAAGVPEKPRSPDVAIVPSQYLVEKLPIGDSFLLSVEQPTSECASKQAGFVCLAMHAHYQDQYSSLLGDIYNGEKAIVPKPGTTFAYLDPSDEGWYRARCLDSTRSALLDGSRVVTTAHGQCRPLAPSCHDIPEFCCVLNGNVRVGMSLKCTILMKTAEGFKVSLDGADESDVYLGEGLVARWMPVVVAAEPPLPTSSIQDRLKQVQTQSKPNPQPTTEAKPPQIISEAKPQPVSQQKSPQIPVKTGQRANIPDIARPDIVNNAKYVLLHVTSLGRACVRALDDATTAEFESVLQDAALYGMQSGQRITEPPLPGQVVLCSYEDAHYRALVTRTKASDNRYMVQYAEYGNEEVVPLEKMFVCPPELNLQSRPARASIVALSSATHKLTEPATEYVDSLKEEAELIATIPTGSKTAPSGSLVQLSLAKNKENVNRKLEEMCTPEWKKLEETGKDIIESDVIHFSDISTLPLPTDRPFVLEVTDFSYLERGILCGFEQGISLAATVYGPLTDKINEYCNSTLCSEPYLPMVEELCLARLHPYPQWFRAVVVAHTAGAATATVLYIDYGNMCDSVPVTDLRKCMREFATHPALAASVDIQGWPKQATTEQLVKAVEFLQVDEEGRGRLPVARCRRLEDDLSFLIEAPQLIAAINSA